MSHHSISDGETTRYPILHAGFFAAEWDTDQAPKEKTFFKVSFFPQLQN